MTADRRSSPRGGNRPLRLRTQWRFTIEVRNNGSAAFDVADVSRYECEFVREAWGTQPLG